ncbi:MAG TPA: 16S rRNA (cytosine(967)-C(5))-methyltransferase RsmB [Solirubrobacteraceae bacterium]|nr:16S rRNA (cytosine(967)-C(5))-methyltransferase RsmB [Solirubrobacteraceae bacterium]
MPATKSHSRVSPARACALRVIRRVFEQGAYADRALAAEAAGLEPRDRALAMALAYGSVQRRATLDHVAAQLTDRRLERLDAPVLAVLRLGLFELLYLGGAAEHAAVNESVELVKGLRPRAAGLANAVLRRASREGPGILAGLDDHSPEAAAVLHSVPGWLAGQWWDELGAEEARALLRVINEPAESALRANTLVATASTVAAALPVASRLAPGLPEGLVLDGPFDVERSELWATGAVQPQSRASMLVSRILDPAAGDRVLDLCAAPGGKTTHLAALMEDTGEIVAVERHPGRAAALERTVTRMRTTCVRVEVGDAAGQRTDGVFDRILVDPPCSGFGTLQSRPDLRWRRQPESIPELAALQARILAAAARALAPGGVLVYSVCTISRAESEDVIDAFLRDHGEFTGDRRVQLLPHRDGTDGFFIARLLRG